MSKEDQLQKEVVKYLRLQYPGVLFFHCPNGGKRNVIEAAKFKTMGVLPGVSDLIIPEPNKYYNGLIIELKVGSNKPTDSQKDFMSKMEERGWAVFVCWNLMEAIVKIDSYMCMDKREGERMPLMRVV